MLLLLAGSHKGLLVMFYINNHSYDISISLKVPDESNDPDIYAQDLVKVRVSPSCNSPKIGCSHEFKVEIVDYEHKIRVPTILVAPYLLLILFNNRSRLVQ